MRVEDEQPVAFRTNWENFTYLMHGDRTEMGVTEQMNMNASDQVQGDTIIKGQKTPPLSNPLNFHMECATDRDKKPDYTKEHRPGHSREKKGGNQSSDCC